MMTDSEGSNLPQQQAARLGCGIRCGHGANNRLPGTFPVPWADGSDGSALVPTVYDKE